MSVKVCVWLQLISAFKKSCFSNECNERENKSELLLKVALRGEKNKLDKSKLFTEKKFHHLVKILVYFWCHKF